MVNPHKKIKFFSQQFEIGLPYGHANGPGLESECKKLEDTKYCHNYYSLYFDVPDWIYPESKWTYHLFIVLSYFCICLLQGGAQNSVFKPSLMNSKNNKQNQFLGLEEIRKLLKKLPKNDHLTDVDVNTCDINLDTLMDLENILIARSPYVKAAVNSIKTVLETHPALLEKDVGIGEDLAK